jgi:hypothetical protein
MSDASKPGRRLAGPKACPDASAGVPASTTDWSQRRHRRRDCTPTSPRVTSARWSQTKEPYLSSVKVVADPQPPLPNFGFNPEVRFRSRAYGGNHPSRHMRLTQRNFAIGKFASGAPSKTSAG